MLSKYSDAQSISKSPLLSRDPVAVVSSESIDNPAKTRVSDENHVLAEFTLNLSRKVLATTPWVAKRFELVALISSWTVKNVLSSSRILHK